MRRTRERRATRQGSASMALTTVVAPMSWVTMFWAAAWTARQSTISRVMMRFFICKKYDNCSPINLNIPAPLHSRIIIKGSYFPCKNLDIIRLEKNMDETLETFDLPTKPVSRRPSHHSNYSLQKLLKQTLSPNQLDPLREAGNFRTIGSQCPRNSSLPSIMASMKRHRAELQLTMYKNHSKLNSSFSGYLQSEMGLTRDELKKKKITKFKKVEEKGANIIETPPLDRDETAYHDLNLRMSPLVNQCFDSLFPAIRYNPTLFSCDKQIYLLGGYHQQGSQELSLFHRYDMEGKRWTQVRSQGESPKLAFCFHTVEVYRNCLVVVGGVSFEGEKGKRFNSETLIYNMERGEWVRARGGVSLKHHASTLFGSTLMISGGINEKEKHSEDLYFITFTGGNMLNPLIFGVHNHADYHEKVSHHKILHTYEIEGTLRNHVKMEGVFSFGGENDQGITNNDLTFINVLGKGGPNLDIKFKKWELVTTNDDRPLPRKDHSFNIINKRAIAVLAGGIDQNGNWLTDIWLLDFVRLQWTRVSTTPSIEESIGYLAGHCACTVGGTVYFYNGNVQKKREKAFWSLETELNSSKSKKTIYSTKLPSFKSFRSNKENFSLSKI